MKHTLFILPALLLAGLDAALFAAGGADSLAAHAREDRTTVIFDGKSPNKLACDTTLRLMPDGSWVLVMLGGGDREPDPRNQVFLSRSHDEGKTWGPIQPLEFGFPREGNTAAMVPSELMVHGGRSTLFFATHDGKFGGWKEWMAVSEDSCKTWGRPAPAPGRLHDRTFIRNHIVTRDGRILLPFQHYKDLPRRNTRNGVLMSRDGGKTWAEHGDIRLTTGENYRGWAENNIVELSDGRIAMIIRADRLGGVLYYAESADGGRTWPEFARKTDIPNPGSKATLYGLGGDTVALLHNPNPKHRSPLALWVSFDGMKTWPYQRVLVAESCDGPKGRLNYPDGFVSADKRWLHFAFDDNRHRAVYVGARLPESATRSPQADSVRPDLRILDNSDGSGAGTPASRLLDLTPEAAVQLAAAKRAGLIEIAPVHLPPPDAGDCDHYGWPIATMTGETIVVMHRRIPGHKAAGAGKPDATMSYGIVLRSADGGKTWSEPYDLRDCMKPEDRTRGGLVPLSHRGKFGKENTSKEGYKVHLHAIGTTRDGAVVAINNHGVFRSDDAGRTWKHFSTALRDDNFPHEIVNLGPNVIDHPSLGLLAFGNWFGEVDKYGALRKALVALRSPDGGATWQVEQHAAGFPQYEPASLLYDGRLLFVTRDQTKGRAHKQMSWQPGEKPQVIDTNLEDPRNVDTVDFCFNPVTKRLEIVRSERYRMELWVWSMDPADWDNGRWTRECRLLAREGKFYSTADGFHPAGAVIDARHGIQHIFIYSGHPNGPAGVFRITRTLDTPKLRSAFKGSP